jgi:predicted DNA-binding protein YlxM (UPF0122 family)
MTAPNGCENSYIIIHLTSIEKQNRDQYAAETVIRIKGHLTEKQFRRLWLHYVEGLDVEEIARQEGKGHSSISESISEAKKKISSFFSKHPTKRP